MHALAYAHQEGDMALYVNDCFVILYVSRLAYNAVHMYTGVIVLRIGVKQNSSLSTHYYRLMPVTC